MSLYKELGEIVHPQLENSAQFLWPENENNKNTLQKPPRFATKDTEFL